MTLNRYYISTSSSSRTDILKQDIKCIFISYQQKDKNEATEIADHFLASGIQVYFDRYDGDLKIHHQSNDAKRVTDAIRTGINNSSHMLIVVSPATLFSTWVPFEIGYGYDRTQLFTLCLKGIPPGTLPEYIRTTTIIRDLYDLNILVERMTGLTSTQLNESKKYSPYNSSKHPLRDIMDPIISESKQ